MPVMSKRARLLWIAFGLGAVIGLFLLSLFLASRHVPKFYRKALDVDPKKQADAGKRMLQQIAALGGAIQQDLPWEAVLTAEEINGWLSADLAKSFPNALPPNFRNPRVAIDRNGVTIACLGELDHSWSVVNLTVEPYMAKPDVLALKIVNVRAGLLPVPMKQVLDQLSRLAQRLDLHIEWRQANGAPVALLSMPANQKTKRSLHIESLKLDEGQISISGVVSKNAPGNSKR